jgi:hypothetical protein
MKFIFQNESEIEYKIQGHFSYQFCFCINTVVTIIGKYFSCQRIYTFSGPLCMIRHHRNIGKETPFKILLSVEFFTATN